MFITLYSYRIKPGQMEVIHSLYREWQGLLRGFVSTELLSNADDPCDIIMFARFKDRDAAWSAVESPGYRAWYSNLAQLTGSCLIVSQYEMLQLK